MLLKRLVDGAGRSPLHSAAGVARMLAALAVGTCISATIGSLSLRLGNVFETDAIRTVWRTWWLGDLSGALVVVPLALAWWPLPRSVPSRARMLEAMAMVLAVGALSEIAFHNNGPLVYVTFPGLLWAALRFGPRGATLAITVTVSVAVWEPPICWGRSPSSRSRTARSTCSSTSPWRRCRPSC